MKTFRIILVLLVVVVLGNQLADRFLIYPVDQDGKKLAGSMGIVPVSRGVGLDDGVRAIIVMTLLFIVDKLGWLD